MNDSLDERQAWLTMNDGVRLDATVCTPPGTPPAGGWPGVLLVHGHGDTGCKVSCLPRARRLAGRGYVAVAYSVRGQGASEGLSFHMGSREILDLQDVVAWVLDACGVHRERLAVAGSSQGGWHAWMAAAHCPQVATVVPENIFTDYAEFAVRAGCLNRWFFLRTMCRRIMTAGFQELARQWAESGDWHLLQAWLRERSPLVVADRIRCPVLVVHGWHDAGMPPNEVVTLFERLPGPKKLYLGGGGHDGQDDPQALRARESLVDRWLDHWLLDRDTGILAEPAITCVRRPGWEEVGVDAIPGTQAPARTLFLRGSGVVHEPGRLQAEAPSASVPSNVNNVPLDPDYGLRQALRDDLAGVAAALRREETVFDGEPLAANLEIFGAPRARLHLLPNHPAFQVHAELYEVDAAGQATLISRGHWGTRQAVPGQHLQVEVELATILYRVDAGHRLRLVIANHSTTYAVPMFHHACTRLFHDDARPSSVALPLSSTTG